MKLVKPKLSKYLDEIKLSREVVNDDLVDLMATNQEIDFEIEGIEFNGCKFIEVDFSKISFKNVNLIVCIF